MFYFTKTLNGNIEALYSGRFAFVRSINGISFEELFKMSKQDRQDTIEEFRHYKYFRLCPLGLIIISLRWFVRVLAQQFGLKKVIYFYYTIRSQYFFSTFDQHEYIVDKKFSIAQIAKLWFLESKAIGLLFRQIPIYYFILICLTAPIHMIIGFIINFHFAFIAIHDGKYINISYRAYLNDTDSMLNKFTQKIWVEKWSKSRISSRDWTAIKFFSEKKLLERNDKLEFFNEYVRQIVKFVVEWTEIDCDALQFEATCSFLRNIELAHLSPREESNIISDVLFWDFFYRHGN